MVTVLKRGAPKEEYVYRATCPDCNSILEFKHSEMRHTSCQREGDSSDINCPVCKRVLSFSSSMLSRIRHKFTSPPIHRDPMYLERE